MDARRSRLEDHRRRRPRRVRFRKPDSDRGHRAQVLGDRRPL